MIKTLLVGSGGRMGAFVANSALKDGEIVERGQHQELVNKGGTYTELYETQFKRALDKMDIKAC